MYGRKPHKININPKKYTRFIQTYGTMVFILLTGGLLKLIHTFELSRMIGKETFEAVLNSLHMNQYNKNLWITHAYREQGFSAIKLHKIKRNKVKGEVLEDSDITHHYMITAIVNTGVMFHGDRHFSNNILSFTPDFERAIIYNLLEILPCLEVYPELREQDLAKWHAWNIYKLRRIDFVFEIKLNNQQYLELLNGGYTLREKTYTRNYYEDEELLIDVSDDEPDIEDSESEYTSNVQYIYYKGKSLNINIYHKNREIIKENLSANATNDYDFLRIEVQVKKNKLNAIIKKFDLIGRELSYIATPEVERYILNYYVQALTGTGIYVTLDTARGIINQSHFRADKKDKLKALVEEIAKRHSIATVLKQIEEDKITHLGKFDTVKKYLRDIQSLGINPLTISNRMAKNTPTLYLPNVSGGSDFNEIALPNIVDMIVGYNEQIKDEQQHGRIYTQEELEQIDKL